MGSAMTNVLSDMSEPHNSEERRFEAATVAIFDPVTANLRITRSILYTIGFRHFSYATSLKELRETIESEVIDLVVAEIDSNVKDVSTFVSDVRHGDLGPNPFVVFVTSGWKLNDEDAKTIIDAGADDLVRRPFSTQEFSARILTHIDSRKRFVITSNYVGPDRRKEARGDEQDNLVDVPNSLKTKVNNEPVSDVETAAAIDLTQKAILAEKLQRQAIHISIAASVIAEAVHRDGDVPGEAQQLTDEVTLLLEVTKDLDRRVGDSPFADATELAHSLVTVAESLSASVAAAKSPDPKDLALLTKLGTALQMALSPGSSEADIGSQIASTVAKRNLRQAS